MAGRGRGRGAVPVAPPPPPVVVHLPPLPPPAPGSAAVNNALKSITLEKQDTTSLAVWLESSTRRLHVLGLDRFIHLDLNADAEVDPDFDYGALNETDQQGDRLVRFLLLDNVSSAISITVEHLQHAPQVYRALKEVELSA